MQKNHILMTTAQALVLYNQVTGIVIYLTVSCVTWWFGDRTMAKALVDMNGNGKDKKGTK